MARREKTIRLLCIFVTALMLCACGAPQIETAELVPSEATPRPEEQRELPRYETELYFPSSDKRRLVPESRQIILNEDISHVEATLRALCGGATTQSQLAVLQNGVSLEKIEMSSEVCNVYFSGTVKLDETQWLITRAAVAATVSVSEGVPFVNLYYNQMDPGYLNRPLGALSPIVENLDVYIRNMELEYEAIQKEREERAEEESLEMRNATVYMNEMETGLLLAQNRIISYAAQADENAIAQILVDEVKKVVSAQDNDIVWSTPCAKLGLADLPLFVSDAEAATQDKQNGASQDKKAETVDLSDVTGVVELTFMDPGYEYDAAAICGALTLTLTGYMPRLRGIRVFFQDETGEKRSVGDAELLTRAMFSDQIGCTISLDYPNAVGTGLRRVKRTVANGDFYKLAPRLQALLSGSAEPGAAFVGFSSEDVKTAYITGDTAVIDWQAGFGDKLRALEKLEGLSIPQERRIWIYIYSIINTLTEFPGIQRVWMLENGRKMGAVGDVYLGNALMRNPGILLEDASE